MNNLLSSKKNYKTTLSLLSVFITLALSGCGGGGGGGGGGSSDSRVSIGGGGDSGTRDIGGGGDGGRGATPVTPLIHDEPAQPLTADGRVKVGVLDSGANKNMPALSGKVAAILRYVGQSANLNTQKYNPLDISNVDDVAALDVSKDGHGSYVSQIIVGDRHGSDNIQLYEAQTTNDREGHSAIYDQLAAIDDLHQHYGVNLFNASWGSYNTISKTSLITSKLAALANSNGLIIFAAGNDARSQPNTENLTPLLDPDIKNGVITVVGVDDADRLYRENSLSGSNACGDAAEWCMAADYVTRSLAQFDGSGRVDFYGTSGAAPQVTRSAAGVWAAYPWMSAAQVKQTLLTTAERLPTPQSGNALFNTTFGWGKLDAARALGGPAYFSSLFGGDFDANVPDGSYAFDNDIAGDAGLIKRGAGTLVLSGQNSWAGNTTVDGGALVVSGSVNNGVLQVNSGGMLSGSGRVPETHNSGIVDLSAGSLTVNGDYTQDKDGHLHALPGNTLAVQGQARIDGSLDIVNTRYVAPGRYGILRSQTLQGQFSQVDAQSPLLTVNNVNYAADAVDVDITQQPVANTLAAPDSASQAGAKVMDSLFADANSVARKQQAGAPLTPREIELLNYAADMQTAANGDAVQQLADGHNGAILPEFVSVLLTQQSVLNQTIANRLSTMQSGQMASPGVWVSYDHAVNHFAPDGWNKAKSEIDNTSVGGDMRVSDSLLLGAFVNTGAIDVSVDRNGGDLNSTVWGGGLYSQYQWDHFYLNGLLSYQGGNADIRRRQPGIDRSGTLKSSTHVNTAGASIESGYRIGLTPSLDVVPFVALSAARVQSQGLSEETPAGQSESGLTGEQTRAIAGARVNWAVQDNIQIGAYAMHNQALTTHLTDLHITPNLTQQEVVITPPQMDEDLFLYGLSFTMLTNQHLQLFANMTGSDDSQQSWAVSTGIKYLW